MTFKMSEYTASKMLERTDASRAAGSRTKQADPQYEGAMQDFHAAAATSSRRRDVDPKPQFVPVHLLLLPADFLVQLPNFSSRSTGKGLIKSQNPSSSKQRCHRACHFVMWLGL
jgi:hypothetical protein